MRNSDDKTNKLQLTLNGYIKRKWKHQQFNEWAMAEKSPCSVVQLWEESWENTVHRWWKQVSGNHRVLFHTANSEWKCGLKSPFNLLDLPAAHTLHTLMLPHHRARGTPGTRRRNECSHKGKAILTCMFLTYSLAVGGEVFTSCTFKVAKHQCKNTHSSPALCIQ